MDMVQDRLDLSLGTGVIPIVVFLELTVELAEINHGGRSEYEFIGLQVLRHDHGVSPSWRMQMSPEHQSKQRPDDEKQTEKYQGYGSEGYQHVSGERLAHPRWDGSLISNYRLVVVGFAGLFRLFIPWIGSKAPDDIKSVGWCIGR